MEQRPLRLGDIVDDYCPRERRLTNHVIVALVGDAIRQTRCSTCDTEHVYKEGRVPRRRKADTAPAEAAASADAAVPESPPPAPAADAGPGQLVQPRATPRSTDAGLDEVDEGDERDEPARPLAAGGADEDAASAAGSSDQQNGHHDLWPAHRPLIRATLPRTQNDPPIARPIPEFTMHQRPPQRGGFRHGHGSGAGWQGGNGQPRFGAGDGRPGRSGGEPNGNVPPGQAPGQGQGRRRSRHRGGKHRRPR